MRKYIKMANQFQEELNLDRSQEVFVVKHDCLHVLLGFGITYAEEEKVSYIENHLNGLMNYNEELNKLAATLPIDFINFYLSKDLN